MFFFAPPKFNIRLMEEILHHLGCIEPRKQWNIYHINWCRISSINSRPWKGIILRGKSSSNHFSETMLPISGVYKRTGFYLTWKISMQIQPKDTHTHKKKHLKDSRCRHHDHCYLISMYSFYKLANKPLEPTFAIFCKRPFLLLQITQKKLAADFWRYPFSTKSKTTQTAHVFFGYGKVASFLAVGCPFAHHKTQIGCMDKLKSWRKSKHK